MTTPPGPKASADLVGTTKTSLPWSSWACLLVAGGIALFPLTCSWSFLTNYSFGWWVPLLALILFWERWHKHPDPAPATRPPRVGRFLLVWGVLFLCIRMALEVSLVARPLVWGYTLLYVGALLYWLWVYGGMPWVRHFAFPVCFLLLGVPWPLQIENPLVQGLAPLNAWLVAQVLVDFGIFAQATGQVIVLPNCTLDVQQACSGLRSIQAALMIAFLVGELYRFSWPRRGWIVLLALALALAGNFLRTLFLALIANSEGVPAVTRWHDTAGASILIFTSVMTWLVAYFLHRRNSRSAPPPRETPAPTGLRPREGVALRLACGILLIAVLSEAATQGWYAWREMGAARYPVWTVAFPDSGKFQDVAIDEESRDLLKYDAGRQIKWQDDQGWSWTAFWFRYHQKAWAVSAFTNHNPSKCLPAIGYHTVRIYDPFMIEVHGAPLQVYPRQFTWEDSANAVFVFWVVYANRPNFPLEEAVGRPNDGLLAKGLFYLSCVWNGKRGSTAETESLETVISGPASYEAAKTAYLAQLQKMIAPEPNPS